MREQADRMTPKEVEDLFLALHGGLKGRFARGFSVLQGGMDALEHTILQSTTPTVQGQTLTILREMAQQMTELERLADHAADLAVSAVVRGGGAMQLVELSGYLRMVSATANQELAHRSYPARVTVEAPEKVYANADTNRMMVLFANLISNSVQARQDAAITLQCTEERHILYRDNGPGLSAAQMALLEGKLEGSVPLHTGGTGLLMIASYAEDLGWKLRPQSGPEGFSLDMELSEPQGTPQVQWQSGDTSAQNLLRCLRREFTATLPPL